MQWAFIACAAIASAITFKHQTEVFLSLLRRLARDAKEAKIGGVQFSRISALDGLSKRIAQRNPTFAQILSDLDPQQLSLLILATREPGVQSRSGQKEAFRSLRSAGLVTSDGRIAEGAGIRSTQLGADLVKLLIDPYAER